MKATRGVRWTAAIGSGSVVAIFVLVIVVAGGIVTAVNGERTVSIPMLVTAKSGSGTQILDLDMDPVGALLWFIVLTAVIALPLGLLRRRRSAGNES